MVRPDQITLHHYTRCLCPVMAMVNHSCDPNCRVYWAASSTATQHRLVLEARRDISAGEEVTITYCCSLLATPCGKTGCSLVWEMGRHTVDSKAGSPLKKPGTRPRTYRSLGFPLK